MFTWRMPGPVAICADKTSLANLKDMLSAANLERVCNFLSDEACDFSELQQWGYAKATCYDNEFSSYLETPGFKVLDWNPVSYLADTVMQNDGKGDSPVIPEGSMKFLIALMDKVDCIFVVIDDSTTAKTAKKAIQREALLDYFINMAAKSPSRKTELQVIKVSDVSHILVYLLETDRRQLEKRIARALGLKLTIE